MAGQVERSGEDGGTAGVGLRLGCARRLSRQDRNDRGRKDFDGGQREIDPVPNDVSDPQRAHVVGRRQECSLDLVEPGAAPVVAHPGSKRRLVRREDLGAEHHEVGGGGVRQTLDLDLDDLHPQLTHDVEGFIEGRADLGIRPRLVDVTAGDANALAAWTAPEAFGV